MSGAIDTLVHRVRPAAGDPEGAVVLLHGRGADEHDLLPLFDLVDRERRFVGVTPRAPLTLPPGGAHWYVVRRVGFPDPATFAPTFERLSAWVDALPEATGVPLERTVIGGFSQGTAMSHALALAADRPRPAGVLALSGFIPTVEGLELDLGARAGMPVFIGHGTYDPVIGVELGRDARRRLEQAGAEVTFREYPIAHSIAPRAVSEIAAWLGRVLAGAAAGSRAA